MAYSNRSPKDAVNKARLISAAHELLEALKFCQVRVFMAEGCSEAYEQARKAIAKAEGG